MFFFYSVFCTSRTKPVERQAISKPLILTDCRQEVLSKAASTGTCKAVASWLVLAASEITRRRSACSASVMPLARAAAVWEWAQ